MLQKQVETDKKLSHDRSTGVEAVNKSFAKDADMMDLTKERYSDALVEGEEEAIDSTQAMRDRIEKEYAGHDSDEVPDSQPEENSDYVINDARTDLLGTQEEKTAAAKEIVIDEQRRRTSRNVSDKNTMDKAKDRANMKNLEVPEGKRTTSAGYRGATII